MTKLGETPMAAFHAWEENVQAGIRTCGTLEESAQRCVSMIYDQFRESVIMARFYAILPFERLPAEARRFAAGVAGSRGAKEPLENETMVLALLGTRGELPAWNDRRSSRGHLAIPLVSTSFVDAIPMVSRMLKELGVPIEWVTGAGKGIMTDTFARLGGFFYVEDAETAVDHMDRKIIPAQDFVTKHRVKTVFGTAGMYVRSRMFITLIIFCRDTIERNALKQSFMPFANVVTNATSDLVSRGRIFAG
jgi:hypothetical protein